MLGLFCIMLINLYSFYFTSDCLFTILVKQHIVEWLLKLHSNITLEKFPYPLNINLEALHNLFFKSLTIFLLNLQTLLMEELLN
jgi:hypothetical protein